MMVRETRHLWIGNLPENVREEDIRDLFQRHGRVQSVKLLSDENSTGGSRSSRSATVAFIDIRSASKALRNVRSIEGQPIQINYHEPGSVPQRGTCEPHIPGDVPPTSVDSPVTLTQGNGNLNVTGGVTGVNNSCIPGSPAVGSYRQQRFGVQHGQSEDTSSHFYDPPKSFSRGRGDGHGFHSGRGRRDSRPPFHNRHSFPTDNRSRNYRSQWGYQNEGRFAPPAHSEVDERVPVPPIVAHPPISESSSKAPRRPESPASSVSSRHVHHKRHRSRSVSESGSSDRGSSVGSRSRSASRSSVSTSVSSGRSRSPPNHSTAPAPGQYSRSASASTRFHQNTFPRNRYSRSRVVNRSSDSRVRPTSRSPLAASPSSSASSSPSPHRKIAAPHSPSHSPSSSKSYSPSRGVGVSHHHSQHHQRRAPNNAELLAAIRIRNLPARSSDTSLKDGLYHEYKKHGKVAWVRVIGNGSERYAIVCFKSAEHAARAVSLSQEKQFFGCKIQVTPFSTGKNDEVLPAPEEESRVSIDEEPPSVGYPTRTVLITGLDAVVTIAELTSTFDQYGDIVHIDVKKQSASTHAICEFVDIASAIRAQWGRHVFKSREARISFYRNSPNNSLLLDGTAGVSEKQVFGHCCQYGAIKRIVIDPDRFLALVQFEEISSAQTAIRQLRSWVIKGKHLQVDFASNEVIKRFLERISTSSQICSVESSSPILQTSCSPSSGTIGRESGGPMPMRRIRKGEEDGISYRRSLEQDGFKSVKSPTSDRSFSYERVMDQKILSVHSGSAPDLLNTSESSTFVREKDVSYRLRLGCTSPVSPDGQNSVRSKTSRRKKSEDYNSRSKIDLNCHETDSAIVTSSSDIIIGEKPGTHINTDSSSSSVNGDEKLSCFRLDGIRRKSVSSDLSRTTVVTVDGVSSTSPEPKAESVRKASPDPGIGIVESVSTFPCETVYPVREVADPRKRPGETKIRRTSADSGNISSAISSHTNSITAVSSYISTSERHPSTTVMVGCVDGNESDDRPGTPLCDENPDCFVSSEVPLNFVSVITPSAESFSLSIKNDPISLPLPEFALDGQRSSTNNSSEIPSSSIRLSRSSSETNLKSPIKSPSSTESNSVALSAVSVMKSSTMDSEIPSQFSNMDNSPCVKSTNSSLKCAPQLSRANHSCLVVDGACSPERKVMENISKPILNSKDKNKISSVCTLDNAATVPDPDKKKSPDSSPNCGSLERRIQKCCEKFDKWNGFQINPNLNSTSQSREDSKETTDTDILANLKKPSDVDSSLDSSSLCKLSLTKHKFLDLEELRHQPSDIGKSVLARRSVFDEDSKRLENYGEKYEAKAAGTPAAVSNWRVLALQRSMTAVSSAASASVVTGSPKVPSSSPIPASSSLGSGGTQSHNLMPTMTASTHRTPTIIPSGVGLSICKSSTSQGIASTLSQTKQKETNYPFGVLSKLNKPECAKISSQVSPYISAVSSLISTSIVAPPQTAANSIKSPLDQAKSPLSSFVSKDVHRDPLISYVSSTSKQIAGITTSSNNYATPSSCISTPLPTLAPTTNNGLQPVIHQGLPRSVERSQSLDSRKNSFSGCYNPPLVFGLNWGAATNAVSSQSHASLNPNSNANTQAVRRSSVDFHLPTRIKASSRNGEVDDKPIKILDVKEETILSLVASKEMITISNGSLNKKLDKQPQSCVVKSSSPTVGLPSETDPHIFKKDLNLIKDEIMELRPVQQETTVAVVAAEVNPFIPSRSDSVGSSTAKESKKDKDKNRSSSDTSTPVGSQNASSSYLGPSKVDSAANQQSSSRDKLSTGKSSEEKKDKKDSKGGGDSSSRNDESAKVEDKSHKKNDDRKDKKARKDSGKEKDVNEHPNSNWKDPHSQHNHRKEKESSAKRKRRGSSVEADPDQKKLKSEKDANVPIESHHHRMKSSSYERRESRDSSCSSKAKDKDSVKTSTIPNPPNADANLSKEKEESRSKDHHHNRSKDKSISSSSKDSHHVHHGDRVKSTDSRSIHQPPKLEQSSSKDKDRSRKDRISPGKENVKSSSRSSNHGSVHVKSSSKSKESSKNKSSKDRSKSYHEKPHNSVDSDSDGSISASPISCTTADAPVRHETHPYNHERERGKSDKHEKRDSTGRRSRHKSGDNPGSGGGSDKVRNREQRKKKKNSHDNSDSTDSDDDETRKHHSIFEVVVDEYVSMYDKVKARSNRACKSNVSQQQLDEQKKMDRMKDQFRQLKQSRAKKVDKKRSTSVDESNRSAVHTSSDESSQMDIVLGLGDESHHRRDITKPHVRSQENDMTQSSDDEERKNESIVKSKSHKFKKEKKSSASGEKGIKKRGRKPDKPSTGDLFHVSTSSVFSNSDYESNASSSHTHEPDRKKKKFNKSTTFEEKISVDLKSSGESHSESNDFDRKKSGTCKKPKDRERPSVSHSKKLQAADVYSDSDSSVESGPARSSHKSLAPISSKPRKDKLGKQKSMRKSLFESSDSSDADVKPSTVVQETKKEKIKESRLKDRDYKSSKKKHRVHSLTTGSSTKSSKKQRVHSGEGIPDSIVVVKKETGSTIEDLFGPMTSSSSDSEERQLERPITPTISPEFMKVTAEAVHSKRLKSVRSHEQTISQSVSPCSSVELGAELVEVSKVTTKIASTVERKKKRHHREKKSRRLEVEDSSLHTPKSTSSELKPVDVDLLFNSPKASPNPAEEVTSKSPTPVVKEEISIEIPVQVHTSVHDTYQPAVELKIEPFTAEPSKHVPKTPGMFSSDEDDDDDDKLKIDINEAIMASSDEPIVEASSDIQDDATVKEKQKLEEEEKKLHSLFEQDKAIESIVLLENKTPPLITTVPDEEVIKDDIPKDCTAISQEETEDAVAAILGTLEDDDEGEEINLAGAVTKPIPLIPAPAHSPPTLRIIENAAIETVENAVPSTNIASNMQACIDRVAKPEKGIILPWAPEGEKSSAKVISDDEDRSCKTDELVVPKTPDIVSRRSSADSNVAEERAEDVVELTPARRASCQAKSRQGSFEVDQESGAGLSADVYEFHDSDEEKGSRKTHLTHSRQTPPAQTLTTKSPQISPSVPAPLPTEIIDSKPANSVTLLPILPVTPITPPQELLSPPITVAQPSPKPVTATISDSPCVSKAPSPSVTPPTLRTQHSNYRTTVDETIEDVIRMASSSDSYLEMPQPALTITSVKQGGLRERSRSKDSNPDDSTMSITKVLSRTEMSPRPIIMHHLSIHGHGQHADGTHLKLERDIHVGKEGEVEGAGLETLIDPQTGILMPMMRQSDEGQYVPLVGQDKNNPQKSTSLHALPIKVEEQGSKLGDREMSRPPSVERPSIFHQQLLAPNQKNEGLAAMFSKQHVFNQATIPGQFTPQANTISGLPQIVQVQPPRPPPTFSQNLQHAKTSYPGAVMKTSQVIYTSSGVFHSTKMPGLNNNSPVIMGNLSNPPVSGIGLTSNLTDNVPTSSTSVHSGSSNLIRASFPVNNLPPTSINQNHYQYAVISRPPDNLVMNRPPLRQANVPTLPSNLNSPKLGPLLPPSQVPGETVKFQIPNATTITKVNSGVDDLAVRKSTPTSNQSDVLLTSSMVSHSTPASPNVLPRSLGNPPNPNLSMTQQQQQQHQAQTELFRRTAEGYRLTSQDEANHPCRPQEPGGPIHPPRVDISGSIAQAAAASPKPGRVPLQFEQVPQPRIQQHSSNPYDQQMVMGSSRGRPPIDAGHYGSHPHQQILYSPLYGTVSSVSPNLSSSLPPTSTYSMRAGIIEKTHQDMKTHEMINPNSLVVVERERINQNLPPTVVAAANASQLHGNDQRNSDSPMLTPMYGNQRHAYQATAPVPAHQSAPRPTFTNPYAELGDRQHPHSPSYQSSFENRSIAATAAVVAAVAASDREASRVVSPYAASTFGMTRRVYSPPPAHIRYPGAHPAPLVEGPIPNERQRQIQVQTPPHTSQVPPQGDSLLLLLQRYPIMWQGLLALKNDNAACQMHFVSGNVGVAVDSLPANPDGSIPPLRISQRMRLEQTQLEGVARKMQMDAEHCILLALPCGRDHTDVLQQSNNLRNGFITYLQLKQAAGIVNICHPITQQPNYVIHIFPSCDFANENLARIAPDLLHGVADIAHLLIVIATV